MTDFFDKYFEKYEKAINITEKEKSIMISRLREYIDSTAGYRFAYQGDSWFELPKNITESTLRENYMLNELAIYLDGKWVHLPSVLRECRCTKCNHNSMYECSSAKVGSLGTIENHVSKGGCLCCSRTTYSLEDGRGGYSDSVCN